MSNRQLVSCTLAVLGLLFPAVLGAQERSRCFVVSSIDHRLTASAGLQGEILLLTREPYSRGLGGVVWWQAFLGHPTPEADPLPWRGLKSDSIEVQLALFDVPSQLIVENSGGALRGYVRLYSDEVGRPPARYSFMAEETQCQLPGPPGS